MIKMPDGNVSTVACTAVIVAAIAGCAYCIKVIADAVINGVLAVTNVYK